jgi:hypothetical protein
MEVKTEVKSLRYEKNYDLVRSLKDLKNRPGIILHPSRVPTTSESFKIMFDGYTLGAVAVENDVRKTLTEPSAQQGKFTDRLKAWENIHTVEDLSSIFSNKRLREVVGSETDINKIKSSLTVNQLTMEEFKKLAEHGSQEVLSLYEYFRIYEDSSDFLVRRPKMAIDLQDSNSATVVLNEIDARKLSSNVYILMERDITSFTSTRNILLSKGSDIKLGFVPSSDILKNDGADAFKGCVRSAVVNGGAETLCIKLSEIPMVLESLPEDKKGRVSLITYVSPKEFDKEVLVKTAVTTPQLTAYQIDN